MMLICAHHKTGTVWMSRVFRGIARDLKKSFCDLRAGFVPEADIYLSSPAEVPEELQGRQFVGIHLIRDPRDVIISGVHYHCHAQEAWLDAPDPRLGGATYRDKINSLDADGKLLFEMERAGGWTIRQMLDWNYDDSRFFELRYEDLIGALGMQVFKQALTFLGMEESAMPQCLEWFRLNSLASTDFVREGDPHVRSGRPRQWQSEMTRRQGESFLARLGDCLVRLGYERDDSWVEQLAE